MGIYMYFLGISPFNGLLGGLNSWVPSQGYHHFPYDLMRPAIKPLFLRGGSSRLTSHVFFSLDDDSVPMLQDPDLGVYAVVLYKDDICTLSKKTVRSSSLPDTVIQ